MEEWIDHFRWLGVSKPVHSPEELAAYARNSQELIEIDGKRKTRYEWTQEQRRIETEIRQQKDVAKLAKACGDDTLRREAQANINALQDHYTRISKAAGLAEQPQRTHVAGFRSVKTAEQLKATAKSDILSSSTKAGGDGVAEVAELNLTLYSPISKDITTKNVVITDERIAHIQERHPGDWERYGQFIGISVTDPDYILKDTNPDTAICIKQICAADEIKHIRTTLRLHTTNDIDGRENSVLTFQKINKKRVWTAI